MPVQAGEHYIGVYVGRRNGRPVFAVADPCTDLASGTHAVGVAMGRRQGRPVLAVGPCQDGVATGEHYVGVYMGRRNGRPVFAVPCPPCGDPEPPDPCPFTVRVFGCGPLPGATVTFTHGSTVVTDTTDSNGEAVIDLGAHVGATDDWTYTITPPSARFGTASGTITPANHGCTWPYPIDISLTRAAGYYCDCGCAEPWPATLYLTFPLGTVALTYDAFQLAWVGSITVSQTAITAVGCCFTGGVYHLYGTATGTANVTYSWKFGLGCGARYTCKGHRPTACPPSGASLPLADSLGGIWPVPCPAPGGDTFNSTTSTVTCGPPNGTTGSIPAPVSGTWSWTVTE